MWLTEEMNSRAKHRPGSHRSRTAESLSLPGPLAVALKVMVEQQILLVNARQQACRPGGRDNVDQDSKQASCQRCHAVQCMPIGGVSCSELQQALRL